MNIKKRELYLSLIQQGNNNLLPFSCIVEQGQSSGNFINFELESAQSYFDSSVLINNLTKKSALQDSDTYIPQEDSNIDHNNIFHVELIAKDSSGISKYNVRAQEELYEYEDFKDSFNIPKFSWSNELFSNSETTIENNHGSVWIGDSTNKLRHLHYTSDSVKQVYAMDAEAEPHTIIFEKNKSNTFLTTRNSLTNLSIDDFWKTETIDNQTATGIESEIVTNLSIGNSNQDVMGLIENDKLWSLQSYYGKAIERDPVTLEIIEEYTGFDAPHKIIWSKYHQAYFVAGTYILWKFVDGNKTAIYSVKDYKIADIDVAPSGHICLILDSDNDDIIRILKPNLYGIALNQTISDGTARFCKYCDQGIFYILVESYSVSTYVFSSYLFNTKNNTLEVIEEIAEISTTTTTTTPAITANKVEVIYPILDDYVNIGEEIEILWNSTESTTDKVKIELYKGGNLYSTIITETNNNGIYKWKVPKSIVEASDYQVKITWIAATDFPANSDMGGNFIISSAVTTTTTTTKSNYHSIGIGFNSKRRHVVNVLNNGLVGYANLNDKMFYGLYQVDESDISDVTCMAVRDDLFQKVSNVSAIRVFVGSEEYLSDKWDSGIIETDKNSIYYGGGDNLTPGETYFVNIQVRDETGWSGVQTKEWIMPK
jgi:hypothetical protein